MRELFTKISVKHELYIPLKVSILTPYNLTIPIGCVILGKRKDEDKKTKILKFYMGKIWRNGGYEEKAFLEIMKFAFSNVESSEKIVVSSFAENAYFIKLLMGTGFRFNKQTTSRGDPKQRLTLWMTIEEFKILMQNNL